MRKMEKMSRQFSFWNVGALVFWAHISCSQLVDSLKNTPVSERTIYITQFYNRHLRYNKDSTYVIKELEKLCAYTQTEKLLSEESLAYSLLADHYARIRHFNTHSTALHKKAIGHAKRYHLPLSTGMALYKAGRYFYNFKQFPEAFEHLLQADRYFEKIGYDKVPEFVEYLFYMGNIYNVTGQTDKAAAYFSRIEKIKEGTNRIWFLINSYDNLAHIHKNKQDYTRALFYFEQALAIARKHNYPDWILLCEGNRGILYFLQGRYQQAAPMLQSAALGCLQTNDRESASGYLYYLIKYHIQQRQLVAAQEWFRRMDTSYKHRSKYIAKRNYYEIKALLAESNHYLVDALAAWKIHQAAKDSLDVFHNKKQLHDIQIRTETDAHLAHLKSVEMTNKANSMVRNILLATSLILTSLLIILYFRERSRRALEKALFVQQKGLSDEKLEHARLALQQFTERMLEKNELIQEITSEIESLKDERQNEVGQLYTKTILTASDWDDFKKLFEKVYPTFFYHQKQLYPQLTQGEVRLLALLKLQLSSTEIASILGVSAETVKKSRQRLRKKLQPADRDKNLDEMVSDW